VVSSIIDSEKISSLGTARRECRRSQFQFRAEKMVITIRKSLKISKRDHKGKTFIVTIWTAILRHEKIPERDSRTLHHSVMCQPQYLKMTE